MINKNIHIYIAVIFCVLAFLYVQKMDYEDEMLAQYTYCERVSGKFWGDYKGIYEEVCK